MARSGHNRKGLVAVPGVDGFLAESLVKTNLNLSLFESMWLQKHASKDSMPFLRGQHNRSCRTVKMTY